MQHLESEIQRRNQSSDVAYTQIAIFLNQQILELLKHKYFIFTSLVHLTKISMDVE